MSMDFFAQNKILMDALLEFAPEDSKLLNIPLTSSAVDPFVVCFIRDDRELNHGLDLLGFMQSLNVVLSKIFAAHKYILTQKNISDGMPQSEIDMNVYLGHLAISEYHTSIIIFFLKLRLIVDELLRIITGKKCNCIGTFLGKFEEDFNEVKPFLVALNASANYIKHNDDFFIYHMSDIPVFSPSLKIKVKRVKNGPQKFDFDNLKENCADNILDRADQSEIILEFLIIFFVENFNKFKMLCETRMRLN